MLVAAKALVALYQVKGDADWSGISDLIGAGSPAGDAQGRRARVRHMRPAIRRRDDLRPRLASTIQKTQNLSKRLEPPIHESSGRRCLPWPNALLDLDLTQDFQSLARNPFESTPGSSLVVPLRHFSVAGFPPPYA